MNHPLVSVIIPTYSRPTTLDRAINSVLEQTYENVEAIVVDDNNPGTEARSLTEHLMLKYKSEPKVKYIQHEFNKNGSAARNTGVRNSNGVYIAFLDDDDIFLPNKVEKQVEKMESLSEDWGACYTAFYTQKKELHRIKSTINDEGNVYLKALMRELGIAGGSNLLLKRSIFDELNGFDESFRRYQDVEFILRLSRKYKIAYVPEYALVIVSGIERNVKIDYEEISKRYIETFKSFIDELSPSDKQKFYICINKERLYHFIRVEHNYAKAVNIVRSGELPFSTALVYLFKLSYKYIKGYIKSRI